ncbi:cell wall-associated hydrolase [Mizugakiibacter sediminis]|uniref:Cell wall-associated hydrolase n=1 Tax=Mizugakiibacter sediminis TaxID=1475481 RepID=A0A0K8QLT1_9GAMM|nr:C40 family peptidase [Mizugakiibacter sediminis]GAP65824.1 cell wall-associated hydrolase [Mizugakiibacter sediminis]
MARRAREAPRFAALAAAALILAACSGAPRRPEAGTPTAAAANGVLFRAIGLVGTPYRYGGNTPGGGFDCSGLVDYVYRTEAGVALPRTAQEIGALDAPRIRRDDLAPGDLVFFRGRGRRITHVGIYVGEGRFVHAPDTGGTVRLDELDGPYWRQHFLYGKRVLD